uniref:Uncharacterized protein n=1 Tax=Panagrolaimus sp. ES5 TaxID=591445 RepID=A0AC34G290_9BILA
MKFLILIFLVFLLTYVDGRICRSTYTGTTTCRNDINYCMEITYKYKGQAFNLQGCSNEVNVNIDGMPHSCSENGIKNLGGPDLTGQYYCCDSDLCNDKKLDANSATKAFGFGLYIILPILLTVTNNIM